MLFSLLPRVLPRDLFISGLLIKSLWHLTHSTLHNPHSTNLITLMMFREVKANLSQRWTKHHVKDAQGIGKDDILGFFISTIGGDECLGSCPGRFDTGKGVPRYEMPDCWQMSDCWLEVSIRKVQWPVISTQIFLGFPVPKSKCWDGSQDSKLPLHVSLVAFLT